MDALTYLGGSEGTKMVRKEVPKVTQPDEILVRIKATGICGTDVHVMHGDFPVNPGVTLGHETTGVVAEVGAEVTKVKVGDRIAVDPVGGCGNCNYCRKGKSNFCLEGGLPHYIGLGDRDGGLTDYLITRERFACKMDDSLTHEQAVLCEPLSTLLRAFQLMQPLEKDDKILVMGGGIIGLLTSTYLVDEGYTSLTLCQRSLPRRQLVRNQCPEVRVLGPEELEQESKQHQGDREWGFDCILESTGNPTAIQSMIKYLRCGGKLVIFGCSPPGSEIKVDPFEMFMKEITIVGSHIQPETYRKAVAVVQRLAAKGKLDLAKLGIELFKKGDWQSAFKRLATREISKAIIVME